MNKIALIVISLLCIIGCSSPEPIQPHEGEFQIGVLVPDPTPAELVAFVGSGSVYFDILNGLSEKEVKDWAVEFNGKIQIRNVWENGNWLVYIPLPGGIGSDWSIRYNLVIKAGTVIGAVGETNHGQDNQ